MSTLAAEVLAAYDALDDSRKTQLSDEAQRLLEEQRTTGTCDPGHPSPHWLGPLTS